MPLIESHSHILISPYNKRKLKITKKQQNTNLYHGNTTCKWKNTFIEQGILNIKNIIYQPIKTPPVASRPDLIPWRRAEKN